jgi:hypothetical protein
LTVLGVGEQGWGGLSSSSPQGGRGNFISGRVSGLTAAGSFALCGAKSDFIRWSVCRASVFPAKVFELTLSPSNTTAYLPVASWRPREVGVLFLVR